MITSAQGDLHVVPDRRGDERTTVHACSASDHRARAQARGHGGTGRPPAWTDELAPADTQELATALAHPTRARILEHLEREELRIADLAERLELPSSTVDYHLRVLRRCRCVSRVSALEAAQGRRQHYYRAAAGSPVVLPRRVLEMHRAYIAEDLTPSQLAARFHLRRGEILYQFRHYGLGIRPIDRLG
jgi:DNA-binding transcriptional ArsR family regulator